MRRVWSLVVVLAACGDEDAAPEVDGAIGGDAAETADAGGADAVPLVCEIIYLNRAGGTYSQASQDDSAANETRAIIGTHTVAPSSRSDPEWADFVACVTGKFARVGIPVVEIEPPTDHIEVVVTADSGAAVGAMVPDIDVLTSPIRCVAPWRGIAFLFEGGGSLPENHCELAAVGAAKLLGLDRVAEVTVPPDVMVGVSTWEGVESEFTDQDLSCSIDGQLCACTGPTQNSYAWLTAHFAGACPP
jgi:hypothetical protein